jgi:hypothetical protein
MSTSETFWTRFDGILFGVGATIAVTANVIAGLSIVLMSMATAAVSAYVYSDGRDRWKESR